MELTINGETTRITKAETISELLAELKIVSGRVAVEVNQSVVRKMDFDTFRLHEGDIVEIVNFVGGG